MTKHDERLLLMCVAVFWFVSALLHVSGYVYLMRLDNKPLEWSSLGMEFRHWLYRIEVEPLLAPLRLPGGNI